MGNKKRKIAIASDEDVAKFASDSDPKDAAARGAPPVVESLDSASNDAPPGSDGAVADADAGAEAGVAPQDEAPKSAAEQAIEYRDKWLRAQAECANISKRLRQEYSESLKMAGMGLARSLLPVLDSFDRTLSSLGDSGSDDPVAQGVRLISDQLTKTLRDHGIKPIEAVGKTFDPSLHEALMQDRESDVPPNTVTQELERGYTMNDRVLRPSKVAVTVGADSEPQDAEEEETPES